MKTRLLLLFGSFLWSIAVHAAELQTWTSKNGHSFEGTFVSKSDTTVTLKGSDGKVVDVPLAALDSDSLAQVEASHAEALKNAPLLVHGNMHLRIAIYPRSDWAHIQFLRAGQPLHNEPFLLHMKLAESVNRRWNKLEPEGLEGTPVETRDRIELRLRMDKGVIVHLTVRKRAGGEFEFSQKLDPPPAGLGTLELRNTLLVPALLEYDQSSKRYKGPFSEEGLSFAELPAALDGYEIEYRNGQGKRATVPYHEQQKEGFGGETFRITHPEWPELEFKKEGDKGNMYIWFYDGAAPFSGYALHFVTYRHDDPLEEAGPFIISVK